MSRWMAKNLLSTALVVLLFFIFTVSVGAEPEQEQKPQEKKPQEPLLKHILIITVNGLGKEGFKRAYTPNINGLAASGVRTQGALTVLPASEPAVIASILTGAEPQVHGFYRQKDRAKVKTLLEAFAGYGRKVALIDGAGLAKGLVPDKYYRSAKSDFAANGDRGVMDQAIREFKAEKPYFMMIVLPGVDGAGHRYGFSSEKYRQAVTKADEEIGRLVLTLEQYGVLDNSLLVVTGDHGFTGKNHGQGNAAFSEEEMMVPALLVGPGLKSAMAIPPIRLVDIAPTLAYVAGLGPLEKATGQTLWNSLRNGRGYNQFSLLEKRVSDLSRSLVDTYRAKYVLEERKRLVDQEKKAILLEKSRTQEIVNGKDRQIFRLAWQIRLMKLGGLLMVIAFGLGYVVEYFILRKKFLMF